MEKPRAGWLASLAFTIMGLVLVLGIYIAGCFALGKFDGNAGYKEYDQVRFFPYYWLMHAYQPMARIETRLTGKRTGLGVYYSWPPN